MNKTSVLGIICVGSVDECFLSPLSFAYPNFGMEFYKGKSFSCYTINDSSLRIM